LVTKAEKEPAIDILKYVNTSTAESVSDFSPQETYWINGISQVTWNEAESDGKLFHIVNVEDLNLLPELSYETKLNLLIEELNNADDEDTDEIWNELGFTEEEKYFLLVYGDASSFMTEAEHVNKSILKLTNLANRLGNPLETVLQQQFLIVNNDLNWYYLESMVEKAERSEMVEFCISRAGSLNLYTKALVTCYKFSKMFEKANDSYMSKLDRRQATYAAYDSICVDLSNILLYEFSPLTKAYLKATGESLPFVTKEIANRVQKEFTKHIIDEAYEPLSQ